MNNPVLLMAAHKPLSGPVEAEPVLVEHDGQAVVLTLENGETLTLDERELRASLEQAA